MSAAVLLDRLQKVRSQGPNRWMACCPAHDDKNPSLAIKQEPDGRVLIHCFAGCGAVDVLAAIGLQMTDIMPESCGDRRAPWWATRPGELTKEQSYYRTLKLIGEYDASQGIKPTAADLKHRREAWIAAQKSNKGDWQ